MGGFFCSLGALFMVLWGVITLLKFFYSDGSTVVYVGIIFFVVSFGMFTYGLIQVIEDYFLELHGELKQKKSKIDTLKGIYAEDLKRLEPLAERFFSHEQDLVEAVKNRKYENLSALLENYPELKAMDDNKELINKIIDLIDLQQKITSVQKEFNKKARRYNKIPFKKLAPEWLEKRIEYIDAG